MPTNRPIFYALLFVTGLVLFSCNQNKFDVDVSAFQSDMQCSRLESEFHAITEANVGEVHARLQQEYGLFYKQFVEQVLSLGLIDDPAIDFAILAYVNDPQIVKLADEVEAKFETCPAQQELETAFNYYQYHFPDRVVPRLVTYTAGFHSKVAATDSVLGIGLEMYLGQSNPYYGMLQWPAYKTQFLIPDYMPYDAMRGWMLTEFEQKQLKPDLLSRMIAYGKVLYAMDALFPQQKDHMKIGYTETQLLWCEANETRIWTEILESGLLFSTNTNDIRKFLMEAPFTSGMPKKSPGQIGYWVGWQIVRSFMDERDDMNLETLMLAPIDGQAFLNESRYKPI